MILAIANFLWLGLNAVLAATVTITDNVYTSVFKYDSDLSIATGVIMAADNAIGPRANDFNGLVTNNGQIRVGDTSYSNSGLIVRFNGGLINKGTVILNAINETSAPTYYFFGDRFQNDGTIIMIGRGDTGGTIAMTRSTFANGAINNGVLAWYQTTRNDGKWCKFGWEAQTVQNSGTICLYQVGIFQASKVIGHGCWSVGHNSLLYMHDPYQLFLWTAQLVYLETPFSHLLFNHQSALLPINVDGWGNGNMIGFQGYPHYAYEEDTLTVKCGESSYKLVIGLGYDTGAININFNVTVANDYRLPYALTYYGKPAVKSRPSVCLKCPDMSWKHLL